MPTNLVRYRIGVLNDFKNSFAFVDVKITPQLKLVDALRTSAEHRGYDVASDIICVFLNYAKVGEYRSRSQARAKIMELIEAAPVEAKEELVPVMDVLIKDL